MKKIPLLFILVLIFQTGCAFFVTKKEVSELDFRVKKISNIVKRRKQEEKALSKSISKAKDELKRIMQARNKYRSEQTAFILKVREKLQKLQMRLTSLEIALERVNKKVSKSLKSEIATTSDLLKQRASELLELEKKIEALIAVKVKSSPENLSKIIKALAIAKEWKLMNNYLALFSMKYKNNPLLGETIYFCVQKLMLLKKFGKAIIYSSLYQRLFPMGKDLAGILLMSASANYSLSICSKALVLLNKFMVSYSSDPLMKQAKALMNHIKKHLHSKAYCAK